MPMIKHSFLTAALLAIALSAVPFTGQTLPHANAGIAFAQAQTGQPAILNPAQAAISEKEMLADAAIVLYRVMGVVLVVWIGLAVFLLRIDRKVARLEKEVRGRKQGAAS
jgi:CcmD family protein